MSVIILTLFICGWVALICLVLGMIQNIFQQVNNKYQRLKQQLRNGQE